MAERKVFGFLRSYYEAAKELPKEEQAEFFMAICSFALDGIEPEINGVAKALFKLAKPSLELSLKRSEAGKSKSSEEHNETNDNQTVSKTESNKSKHETNANQNEANDNQNVTPKKKMNNEDDKGIMSNEDDKGVVSKEKAKKNDAETGFDTFWDNYPRHDSKQKARESYNKALKKGVTLDVLLLAIEKQKQSRQWQENGGQYIPYASTWLNQERWEDEVNPNMPRVVHRNNDVQAGYEQAMRLLGVEESG